MTKDEEDALIARYLPELWAANDPVELGNVRGLIRAAVAQERERCAKVCEDLQDGWGATPDQLLCAAAIRRGE